MAFPVLSYFKIHFGSVRTKGKNSKIEYASNSDIFRTFLLKLTIYVAMVSKVLRISTLESCCGNTQEAYIVLDLITLYKRANKKPEEKLFNSCYCLLNYTSDEF